MRKLLSAAALASALFASTAANAASLLFKFDPAASSIVVTDQGDCFGIGCSVTPTLDLPTGEFAIEEGASQFFSFAKLNLAGVGWDSGVKLKATLAFLTPDVDPATSNGSASYGTFFGIVNAGKLTWSNIAPITTGNGSQFIVDFQDLKGLGIGTVSDGVTIKVTKAIASPTAPVPEPGTWALMIGGFGMAGAMLRRRRQLGVAVAA